MIYRVILLLSILSFCFLSALAQQPTATYDFAIGKGITSRLDAYAVQWTSYVVSGNRSTLNMINKYVTNTSPNNPGPFCYLEVTPRPEYNSSDYWTKPCPRTPQQGLANVLGFWCRFNFTSDGNLVLTSGANETSYENGKVMWSSNTGGMGVQSMALFESSDPAGMGNTLVLYNANMEIVWGNIANNPASEEYRCTDAAAQTPVGAPTPSAARKLLQH